MKQNSKLETCGKTK